TRRATSDALRASATGSTHSRRAREHAMWRRNLVGAHWPAGSPEPVLDAARVGCLKTIRDRTFVRLIARHIGPLRDVRAVCDADRSSLRISPRFGYLIRRDRHTGSPVAVFDRAAARGADDSSVGIDPIRTD